MKKILLAVGALLLLAVIAVAGLGFYLASKLNTSELEKQVLAQAKATLGTEIQVQDMEVSLLSGVTLEGIRIANPAPFAGDLLTAEAFVLRYRLLPLLAGRVQVDRLALEKPVLALAMDAKGGFNYEKLGGAAAKGAPATPAQAAPTAAAPLRIVMKSLAVENGSVVMNDQTKARLMAVEDIDFRSAFEVARGVAQGAGQVTIGKANFADVLFVRAVKAPLSMSKEKVTLSPIRGALAGGEVSGDLKVDLKGGFRFTTDLGVKGASVKTLLAESGSAAALSGTLSGKAHFEGKGGLATMRGQGSADIASCRAENSRVLALLASVLQVPEVANPDFEACRVEFNQTGSRFATPVVKLTGDAVRLSGRGSVNLDTSGLDYEMTLGLAPKLFAKITRPELRAGFKQDTDGFATIDFRLYGTTLEPKTDLLSRVGKAAATGVAKDQVNKLLKTKIF
jgi:uncharacterized protein involved in outer membrane biogenesis